MSRRETRSRLVVGVALLIVALFACAALVAPVAQGAHYGALGVEVVEKNPKPGQWVTLRVNTSAPDVLLDVAWVREGESAACPPQAQCDHFMPVEPMDGYLSSYEGDVRVPLNVNGPMKLVVLVTLFDGSRAFHEQQSREVKVDVGGKPAPNVLERIWSVLVGDKGDAWQMAAWVVLLSIVGSGAYFGWQKWEYRS